MLETAFCRDRRDTVDLMEKFLLSLGVAHTVKVLSFKKALLKTSVTLVFPSPIYGWGISRIFRKC